MKSLQHIIPYLIFRKWKLWLYGTQLIIVPKAKKKKQLWGKTDLEFCQLFSYWWRAQEGARGKRKVSPHISQDPLIMLKNSSTDLGNLLYLECEEPQQYVMLTTGPCLCTPKSINIEVGGEIVLSEVEPSHYPSNETERELEANTKSHGEINFLWASIIKMLANSHLTNTSTTMSAQKKSLSPLRNFFFFFTYNLSLHQERQTIVKQMSFSLFPFKLHEH